MTIKEKQLRIISSLIWIFHLLAQVIGLFVVIGTTILKINALNATVFTISQYEITLSFLLEAIFCFIYLILIILALIFLFKVSKHFKTQKSQTFLLVATSMCIIYYLNYIQLIVLKFVNFDISVLEYIITSFGVLVLVLEFVIWMKINLQIKNEKNKNIQMKAWKV